MSPKHRDESHLQVKTKLLDTSMENRQGGYPAVARDTRNTPGIPVGVPLNG
jgi:hypothetical protein